MVEKQFTFFWKTGHREVFKGETAHHAFKGAGYGPSALAAVDLWEPGDSHAYSWNKETRTWTRNENIPIQNLVD